MTFERFFGHDIDFSKSAQMWTIHHLILTLVALTSVIITLKISDKIKNSTRETKIKYTFIGLLVILEISYHIHNWTYPRFSVPLHVCSFAVFLLIALLITDNKAIWNYAFFYRTIGGIILVTAILAWLFYKAKWF